jgi:hypothetical protein
MKTVKLLLSVAIVASIATSCKKGCTDPLATNYDPKAKKESKKDDKKCIYPAETGLVELTGDLETQTLTADQKYLIKGQVFVRSGKVLTIEPGTIIMGDKKTKGVLVIDKGGKIEAEGTVTSPIVFTSNQEVGERDRGDWGGLVILGNANVNQNNPAIEGITPEVNFGTTGSTANDGESSGTLKYVRVEFAGIELTPNNETNSITMGAVGRGTTMEYCMVSFGGDDGFEWFGGTVNGKHFISFASWDDCYDVDFGYSGNVQFGLAVRYPSYADQSGSNGFECDNGPDDNDVQPYTTGTFSNMTIIGPILEGATVSNGNFQHAIDLRRRTAVSIVNSVFAGYPRGIRMNQASVYGNYTSGTPVGILSNNILLSPSTSVYLAGTGVVAADVETYWLANNETVAGPSDEAKVTALGIKPGIFYQPGATANNYGSPDFTVTSGTAATGADFTLAKFSETNRSGFFTTTTYRGAFGATNWTAGWAEFNPMNKEY